AGNDANTGDDPQRAVRSIARLQKLMARDTTILFHRGERFDITQGLAIDQPNVVIGAYGENPTTAPRVSPAQAPPTSQSVVNDDRPLIRYVGPRKSFSMIRIDKKAGDVMIENLAFDSIFDHD